MTTRLRFIACILLSIAAAANVNQSVAGEENSTCPKLEGPFLTDLEGGDTLNLYEKPRMNSDILGLLPSNAGGIVSGKCKTRLHNQWCQVQWGCVSGYARMVMMAHTSTPILPEDRVSPPVVTKVSNVGLEEGAYLTLYAGPNESFRKTAAIPLTAQNLRVLDCVNRENEWCAITLGSVTGWGLREHLKW
ncbi:MAG: hypothetical protein ACU0AZ_13680 [Paracoccaceae bacterium]